MASCNTCKANKVCDHNKYGFENCNNYISADVVEVRHGRDVGNMNDRDDWYEPVHICSICDCGFMMDFDEEAHYCPNCGAKMEGGAE